MIVIFYYRNLYLTPGVENPVFVVEMLEDGVSFFDIYAVSLGFHGNLMEILPTGELFKEFHTTHQRYIIGFAAGKGQAFDLSKTIASDYFFKMNTFAGFHDYFSKRCV